VAHLKDKWPRWSPDKDIADRWEKFVAATETRERRKNLGNRLVNEAIRAYLKAQSEGEDATGKNSGKNSVLSDKVMYYSIHIARAIDYSAQLASILGEALTELRIVTGDTRGSDAFIKRHPSPFIESAPDAASESVRAAEAAYNAWRESGQPTAGSADRELGPAGDNSAPKKRNRPGSSGGAA
jgi:hypothetical protein